ncbi:unnamed protein product [Sphagnum compactum]
MPGGAWAPPPPRTLRKTQSEYRHALGLSLWAGRIRKAGYDVRQGNSKLRSKLLNPSGSGSTVAPLPLVSLESFVPANGLADPLVQGNRAARFEASSPPLEEPPNKDPKQGSKASTRRFSEDQRGDRS